MLGDNSIENQWPLTSMLVNFLYSSNADFNEDLLKANYTGQLGGITLPTLVLFGYWDFICPVTLGIEFINHLGSTDKQLVISPISGHEMMDQDPEFFCSRIDRFLASHAGFSGF